MTGTTGAAWNDPVRGGELAKSQIDQGADVVYARRRRHRHRRAAGRRRRRQARHRRRFQPERPAPRQGPDLDGQARRHRRLQGLRGRQERQVDGRHRRRSASTKTASATPSTSNNKALVTPEMKAAVDKAKADIIAGTVKVHDYMSDSACPTETDDALLPRRVRRWGRRTRLDSRDGGSRRPRVGAIALRCPRSRKRGGSSVSSVAAASSSATRSVASARRTGPPAGGRSPRHWLADLVGQSSIARA